MADCLSQRTKKLMTFVGGFLMLLPNGVTWYWGNMAIYVYSYFHYKNKTNPHDVRAPWLLSMYVISWSTAILVSGYISNKMGKRPTLLLGIAIFDGGLIASYFVFSESLIFLDLTMGVVSGFGNGMIHAVVLQTVVDWTVSRVGLATAFMFTSYAIGSTIANQLITHYLNPDNKKVDVIIGETHYFSQKDILRKVPSTFLCLAVGGGLFHMVGFLLLRIKRMTRTEAATEKLRRYKQSVEKNPTKGMKKNRKTGVDKNGTSGIEKRPLPKTDAVCSIQVDDLLGVDPSFASHGGDQLHKDKPCMDSTSDESFEEKDSSERSPCQVLRSSFFYVLWLTMFGSDTAYMTLFNYYKIYGQVWIKDDHFLTNLGTTLALATIGMRLIWGFLTDVIGMKLTLVILTSGLALVSTGYYFAAQLNKWLFFATTIVFACLNCGIYTNFMVAIHSLYGKAHFTSNCGLVASSTIVLNLIFPSTAQFLLAHSGWFALFFTIGVVNFCCLLLIICALPE